jgi:D-sedoheptulose 7-phosphate isomerase
MLEQRIQQQFFDSADLQYQTAEGLARPLADAALALFGCLTSGGKLLVAGSGASAPLASMFGAALAGRFERERPALAAVVLDPAGAFGLVPPPGPEAAFVRQVQALGQPGDLLLLLDAEGADGSLRPLVQAAHESEMNVIALTGAGSLGLRSALGEADVLVAVAHPRRARVSELHLLALNCLCDAIDLQLMGEQETT